MTRREAARALRVTLRELTATTAAATKFANHTTGIVLTFRHELLPAGARVCQPSLGKAAVAAARRVVALDVGIPPK